MRLSSSREQRSASRPVAAIENSAAGSASISRKKSRATASGVEAWTKIGRGGGQPKAKATSGCRCENCTHPALPFSAASTAAGVASTTRALRRKPLNLRFVPGRLLLVQQRSAVKVDGVVGIFERVAGEHQNHRFARSHFAFGAQFLQPARVTADAGSQPSPSAPSSALAMAISASVTSRHQPPVS